MKLYFENLGSMLKKLRVQSALSQEEVAKKLGYESYQFISNWERGVSSPPCKALKKVAKIYKVPPEDLFDVLVQDSVSRVKLQLKEEFKSAK